MKLIYVVRETTGNSANEINYKEFRSHVFYVDKMYTG